MKRLSMVSGLTAALALTIAGTASADTTLGSAAQPSGSTAGGGGCGTSQVIAQFTDNPSDPYFVPAAGKISQWQMSTSGGTPGSPVTLVVLKPNPGGTFTVVGADSRTVPSPLPAGNVASFTVAAPITVAAGDTLGLYMPTANTCLWFGGSIPAASTLVALVEPSSPASGQTLNQRSSNPISPPSYTMNLAATFVANPTGEQAAALKRCKRKHRKAVHKKKAHHALTRPVKKKLGKKFRKCKRKANRLPV